MTWVTLLVLHVLGAAVGFGAVLLTGVYAGLARRSRDGATTPAVRRYFRPGTNWPARALYVVPVLGVALVELSHGSDRFAQLWLWVSLVVWALAAVLAQTVVWPGERRIQAIVAGIGRHERRGERGAGAPLTVEPPERQSAEMDRVCRRVERAAAAIDVAFVVTVVLMVSRPGGGG